MRTLIIVSSIDYIIIVSIMDSSLMIKHRHFVGGEEIVSFSEMSQLWGSTASRNENTKASNTV